MTWPALPLSDWRDTCATLHLWTQIVGKIRMVQGPPLNHSWHSTLYVTSSGLTTSPIPHGDRTFQIDFDFLRHRLAVQVSDALGAKLAVAGQVTVALSSVTVNGPAKVTLPVFLTK